VAEADAGLCALAAKLGGTLDGSSGAGELDLIEAEIDTDTPSATAAIPTLALNA
jgi:hypothetical protein